MGPMERWAYEDQNRDSDHEPFCSECGSERPKYIETHANGDEYECLDCGKTMHVQPKSTPTTWCFES